MSHLPDPMVQKSLLSKLLASVPRVLVGVQSHESHESHESIPFPPPHPFSSSSCRVQKNNGVPENGKQTRKCVFESEEREYLNLMNQDSTLTLGRSQPIAIFSPSGKRKNGIGGGLGIDSGERKQSSVGFSMDLKEPSPLQFGSMIENKPASFVPLHILPSNSPINADVLEVKLGKIHLDITKGETRSNATDSLWELDVKSRTPQLDDFSFVSVLGAGAYGKVFLAAHSRLKKVYAIKVLRKSLVFERDQVEHANSEREVLASISHPFLVHLHCAFQTKSKLYLVLDYIPGGELFTRLNEQRFFLENAARFYIAEIILAIEYLHECNIVYRDLKPENILLGADGHIVLTDFGLAKYLANDNCRTFCGTVEYMAPEVMNRQGSGYTRMVDWWSVGALLYEMLTGATPFAGPRNSLNRRKVEQNILDGNFKIPRHVSIDAGNLIKALLKRAIFKRLGFNGASEIKQHDFFKAIDWQKVQNKEYEPPFIPKVTGADVSRFDTKFTEMLPIDSPDEFFLPKSKQDHFLGFSFNRLSSRIGPV